MDAPTSRQDTVPLPADHVRPLDPELERLSAELLAMLPDSLPEPAPTHGPYSDLAANGGDDLTEGIAAIFRQMTDAGASPDGAEAAPGGEDEPTLVLLGELDRLWARPAP